ncbi:MAG: hypothetical protein ABII01_06345 [Candidatus Woesearchaeota archaeon]
MIKSRKASLELSVNAIVIIVLAMTLLGLGLFFIRGLFGNVIDLSESTFSKISDEVSQKLSSGRDKLLFSSIQFTLERGKTKLEGFGIRNDGNAQLNYGVKFYSISCPDLNNTVCNPPPNDNNKIDTWFTYVKGPKAYQLAAGDSHVKRVEIKIPSQAKTGLYLIKMVVFYAPDEMAAATPPSFNASTESDPSRAPGWKILPTSCVTTSCAIYDETEIFLTVA